MTIEIPFNETLYRNQTKLRFDLSWNVNLKKNYKNLFWSIPLILIGIIMVYTKNYIGYLLIAVGVHYIIKFYEYYSYYKKQKTAYFEAIENEIRAEIEAKQNAIWEFEDDYFGYKYHKAEYKLKWKTFINYRIIEKNVFLNIGLDEANSFVLAEEEVGKENFVKIISFIKEKLDKNSA